MFKAFFMFKGPSTSIYKYELNEILIKLSASRRTQGIASPGTRTQANLRWVHANKKTINLPQYRLTELAKLITNNAVYVA